MDRLDMIQTMYDKKGPVIAKTFEKRGFEATYCPSKEEALQKAISYIPSNHVVSWEVRLQSMISDCAHMCWNIIPASTGTQQKTPEERAELMRKALLCDTFIMGTNAAIEDGALQYRWKRQSRRSIGLWPQTGYCHRWYEQDRPHRSGRHRTHCVLLHRQSTSTASPMQRHLSCRRNLWRL